ncbi:MAG: AMP-binding protein [Methylomonas sp.]|nr:AMP-binding protein [Methylomonas sp.]
MPIKSHPLLSSNDQPFAVHDGRLLSRGELWADVRALAEKLPDRPYVFNLCENRYLFCICLLAAATRGQICLLPPSGRPAVIADILKDYPRALVACDKFQAYDFDTVHIAAPRTGNPASAPEYDWAKPSVIAFTSGSTGKPKPCVHSLETFGISAGMAVRALDLTNRRLSMVSTTPQQHMYGLETSVFWPLFSELVLYDERPFFPEDIRLCIAGAPYPALLLTTPTHLRTLVKTEGRWPNLAGVISATDTLSERAAREIAAILGQSPREIYGSTETLSFACRDTLRTALWQPYAGVKIIRSADRTLLESPHLPSPVRLQDTLEPQADGRFDVLGRNADMVKIGGKRTSLSELNKRLTDIEGVEDGFCLLQTTGKNAGRLAAVVVSHLDKPSIRKRLLVHLDEVFVPKTIYFVEAIERCATGKLSLAAREKLLAELGGDV